MKITKLTNDIEEMLKTGKQPALSYLSIWLDEIKNSVWKCFDDIHEQYINCTELSSNEVEFHFVDVGLTIRVYVEYARERIFIYSVTLKTQLQIAL